MRRAIGHIGLLTILMAGILSATGILMASGGAIPENRKLARHYYLEGARRYGMQEFPEAYEYFAKAHAVDPDYEEASLEYAMQHLPVMTIADRDSLEIATLIANSKGIAEKYPTDFFTLYTYSGLCQMTGNIEESIRVMERFHTLKPGHVPALETLSDLYLDHHDYGKALEIMEEYERIEGFDAKTTLRKAAIMMAMGDTVGMLREPSRLIATDPTNPQYWVLKGQLENYVQMSDSALQSLQKAEELSGEGAGGAAKLQLAEIYLSRGDSTMYDTKIYESLMADDLPYEVKHDILGTYLQRQLTAGADITRGDRLFETLQHQYPHEPTLQWLAARYQAVKQDYPKALEEMEYGIDLDPVNEEYRAEAIRYAYFAKDFDAMKRLYKEAERQLSPLDFETVITYARLCAGAELYDDALSTLTTLAKRDFPAIDPTAPLDKSLLPKNISMEEIEHLNDLYQAIGDVYMEMGDKSGKTFVCYANALQLDPQSALTLNNYAYYIVKDKADIPAPQMEEALKMSEKAVTLEPENPTYLDTRAWVLYRNGEFEKAKEIQEMAIEISEKDTLIAPGAEYYDHYGDILNALGDKSKAKEYWKKALDLEPDNQEIKRKLK